MTKKNYLKILVIGTTDTSGGAARIGWDIGNEMIKRGHDVKYIVGYKKSNKKNVYELHKPYFLKYLDKKTRFNITATFRHARSYFLANNIDFGASEEILNHSWYKNSDIVHFHNIHGNFFKINTLLKISKKKKIIWTLHDMSPITGKCAYSKNPNNWKSGYHPCKSLNSYPPMLWDNSKYMWKKKKQIYEKIKITTISPSKWLFNIIKKSILKKQKNLFIGNGIDTKIFSIKNKLSMRKKLELPLNKKIVLFIAQGGANDPRKGWQYTKDIINSYKNNKLVHFVCVGGGTTRLIENNITYIPFLKNKKTLSEYYSAADSLLFTSLAENCPLVILEAMACGLPIVTFNVGGVGEIVEHKKNGYVARYLNKNDLFYGMEHILNLTKINKKSIEQKNRQKAINLYSIKSMSDKYEKAYKKLSLKK